VTSPRVDRVNFSLTVLVLLGLAIPLLFAPAWSAEALQTAYDWITRSFGWFYVLTGALAVIIVLYIGMSRHGQVRLGDSPPEFSTFSWGAMLFAAGIGAGLMYWSGIEWAYYVNGPPFGAEPGSAEAYQWAASYGIHHWGVIAWSLYCLPTLAIAYPFYVRKLPRLKYSISGHYWFKGEETSLPSRLMDVFFMVALIGGAGSSLGFSTPLISALLSRLTGFPLGFTLELVVVGICVVLFATSVGLGLGKGIRRLSNINIVIAIVLLLLIVVLGDTLFLLKMAVNTIGHLMQNIVAMTFWTDPMSDSGFVEDWTIFYWAWWISYGPFVGLFVTRISQGRSLREMVVGMLVMGSLGCWAFYLVLGHHGLGLQLSGAMDLLALMSERDGSAAIVAGLDTLPYAEFILASFCVVTLIFCATTYDSASYTLAASATQSLHPMEDPPRWHRLFWAGALAILPIALIYAGGIREAQTAVLVVSLPLVATLWLAAIGLLRSLNEDHPVPAACVVSEQ